MTRLIQALERNPNVFIRLVPGLGKYNGIPYWTMSDYEISKTRISVEDCQKLRSRIESQSDPNQLSLTGVTSDLNWVTLNYILLDLDYRPIRRELSQALRQMRKYLNSKFLTELQCSKKDYFVKIESQFCL